MSGSSIPFRRPRPSLLGGAAFGLYAGPAKRVADRSHPLWESAPRAIPLLTFLRRWLEASWGVSSIPFIRPRPSLLGGAAFIIPAGRALRVADRSIPHLGKCASRNPFPDLSTEPASSTLIGFGVKGRDLIGSPVMPPARHAVDLPPRPWRIGLYDYFSRTSLRTPGTGRTLDNPNP